LNNNFENLGLSHGTLTAIRGMGFTEPTQIQGLSIPHIASGTDVIGESATGSGKTLAFGCGILENVVPNKGLQALVLTPTRELAEQVKDSLNDFSEKKNLKVISIYGGVSIKPQIRDLKKAEVVVATPGRLLDHIGRKTIDTSKINVLVLDEADRMFDMGFIDDVKKIIHTCPKDRQTLFFSATISGRVRKLGKKYMKEKEIISAKKQVDPSKLKQVYYDIPRNLKLSLLVNLLKKEKSQLAMVFCNTRRTTDFVSRNLKTNGIKAIAIHGGLSQNKRIRTINSFNDGKVDVLVCTDVAARGLDIQDVSHVYNYDLPRDAKDYIHRIGRTARAGEEGKAVNLLSGRDHDNFSRILDKYRSINIEKVKKPHLKKLRFVKTKRRHSNRRRSYHSKKRHN